MNKLFTKIAALALGATMAVGVGVAVGTSSKEAAQVHAAGSGDWVEVTSLSSLNTTDTYVIANTENKGKYMNGTVNSGHFQSSDFSASAPASASAAGAFKLVTIDAKSNIYKIKLVSTSKYVTASKAGSGGGKVDSSSDTAGWKFLYSSNFDAIYQTAYSNKYAAIRCYSGSSWRTYSNGNNASSITTTSGTSFKLYKYQKAKTWTVSFTVNTAGYGSVSPTSIANVPDGASITTNGNKITINNTTVTATPTTNTAQYTYAFTGWSNNTGTVTAARTITANFSRTTNTFPVDGSNITHGSLDNTSNIEYDGDLDLNIVPDSGYTYPTSVSVTMGGNDISNDVQYENGHLFYSPVRGNIVITATCPATGTAYPINTTVTNGTYSGDTTITDNGGVASVTIAPTGDYKLPASVSVSGADHTYNDSTGVISLSNATGNVTISAAMVPLTEYSIAVDETNGSHTGASTIKEKRTATLTFTPDTGWGQPADVTVSGAEYTWTRGTGVLSLSNPTGNVAVTYAAAENELTGITLSKQSGDYTLGDPLDDSIVVTAHYSVTGDKTVTPTKISGYDPYTTGNQTVTFKFNDGVKEESATYTARVSAKEIETITTWTRVTSASTLRAGGTFILGYEETANSGVIIPMANTGSATTSAAGFMYSGSSASSGGTGTITMSTLGDNGSKFEIAVGASTAVADAIYLKAGDNYIGNEDTKNNCKLYTEQSASTSYGVEVGDNDVFTLTIAANKSYTTFQYNSGSPRFAVYGGTQKNIVFYKKVTQSSGTPSLIRIVCDSTIDPATGYKGGDKFVGDKVYTTDFVVKKQLDTGTELTAITGFTINGGTEVTLNSTSNTITISYTENNIPKTTTVVVSATERSATLNEVVLSVGAGAQLDGYIAWSGATWNLNDIKVQYIWSDSEYDTEATLQSLVDGGEATISPATPTLGATSFTVTYSYMEVSLTNNTVTLDKAVRSDYVKSMSWGNTTAAHFKHFSGEQLTEEIVNTWHVKATYAGAGEGSRLYWGDYDLYIGNKQITSLPYTWLSEDDGQALSIHYGEDVDGNEFVKTNTTAVGNICATINAIDHDEEHSGMIDKTATWTKEQSAEIYDGGSNLTELCDNGVDIDTNIHMQGDSTAGNTQIRFWNDGIRCYNGNKLTFTPKNDAVIKKITFASTGISFADGVTDSTSSPFTINDGFGGSAITLSFSLSSTVKMGADVVVEYQIEGKEKTTVHYANQMEHFEAQKAVVKFAKAFNAAMDETENCTTGLSTAWEACELAYNNPNYESTETAPGFLQDISSLSQTEQDWAKNMLNYATKAWSDDSEPACVERMMKTYQVCVQKHEMTPFMSDFITLGSGRMISPISTITNNAESIAIITVISIVSLSAIGGYFFLRKRREQN